MSDNLKLRQILRNQALIMEALSVILRPNALREMTRDPAYISGKLDQAAVLARQDAT